MRASTKLIATFAELLAAKAREWLRLHSTLGLPALFARLRSCLYNHKFLAGPVIIHVTICKHIIYKYPCIVNDIYRLSQGHI